MKTIIKIQIENDYTSNDSHDFFIDEINELVNELDIFCEVKNNRLINVVNEAQKNDSNKDDYKKSVCVSAIGYSQSDWQDYIIYYNKESKELEYLKEILKKTFTHQNDYFVSKFEVVTNKGKKYQSEAYDYTNFSITNIEFPNADEVLKEYLSIYGKDYDEVVINVD